MIARRTCCRRADPVSLSSVAAVRNCTMAHEDAAVAKMADLFDPEPETWGLRGDPYLWRALREHLSGTDIPASADEAVSLLHAAFGELAGLDLVSGTASPVYRAQYAHGGMSSGMISLDAWRQRLMPMLAERARTLLDARSR
jgi:hypothetical protein